MTQHEMPLIVRHADLDTAIVEALAQMVVRAKTGSETGEITVMFAGEGDTAEAALQDAVDDIRERCGAEGCAPVGVQAEPMLRTDTGVRIWGTLTCVATTAPPAFRNVSGIDLDQEGGTWTLTITAT